MPSLDSFSRDMMVSRPDEIHLVATDSGSDVILAHTAIYNVERYRHAYVSVLSSSDAPFGTGVKAWIAVALYGFAALSLRKVYAEDLCARTQAVQPGSHSRANPVVQRRTAVGPVVTIPVRSPSPHVTATVLLRIITH